MAAELVNTLMMVVQIIVQFVAAFFSYKIYTYNRLAKSWLAVVAALILMGFRRMTALLTQFNLIPDLEGSLLWLDKILLPFLISILLVWGIWSMKKQFESFRVIEDKMTEKVKLFSKSFVKGVKRKGGEKK
jgi:hypothetical protein